MRGRRRDVDDNLYRIAPPSLLLALTLDQPDWFITLQNRFVARQNKISQIQTNDPANPNNSNAETPGYNLVSLFGQYRLPGDRLTLSAGVDNLLDRTYTDHLSGFSRTNGPAVARGQRFPGAGRNAYLRLNLRWN